MCCLGSERDWYLQRQRQISKHCWISIFNLNSLISWNTETKNKINVLMPYVQEVGPEILVPKIVEIYLDSATLLS